MNLGMTVTRIHEICDAAGVPAVGESTERVAHLAVMLANAESQLEERRKATQYAMLLRELDTSPFDIIGALADACIDEGLPAEGWGWLYTHKRWPVVGRNGLWTFLPRSMALLFDNEGQGPSFVVPDLLFEKVYASMQEHNYKEAKKRFGGSPMGTLALAAKFISFDQQIVRLTDKLPTTSDIVQSGNRALFIAR